MDGASLTGVRHSVSTGQSASVVHPVSVQYPSGIRLTHVASGVNSAVHALASVQSVDVAQAAPIAGRQTPPSAPSSGAQRAPGAHASFPSQASTQIGAPPPMTQRVPRAQSAGLVHEAPAGDEPPGEQTVSAVVCRQTSPPAQRLPGWSHTSAQTGPSSPMMHRAPGVHSAGEEHVAPMGVVPR